MSNFASATIIEPLRGPLVGTLRVPGDKSISHRAILLSAMAEGASRLSGVLDSSDVRATIAAVRALGAQVNLVKTADGSLEGGIVGWGACGPVRPDAAIDCGNSATTARLLMGVVAPWDIEVELTGDASLRRRPMGRVLLPLVRMGVRFSPEDADTLPVRVVGRRRLRAIEYEMPVPSAQVKSAVLLAGLFSEGVTRVIEPAASRNHTELMLPSFGVAVTSAGGVAHLEGPADLQACEMCVPGDPSSAAFIACAAALVPGSAVQIEGVSLNPTRIGFLRTLEQMGVEASRRSVEQSGRELTGIISVQYCDRLHGCEIPSDKIPTLIDEIPVLCLVAARARGTTVFRGVEELRVKETDRIAGIIEGLSLMGVDAWMEGGDLFVEGDPNAKPVAGSVFDSHGDHRLAMTWALAGMTCGVPVSVASFDSVAVSYPGFLDSIRFLNREM